jgi:hypothetical protein
VTESSGRDEPVGRGGNFIAPVQPSSAPAAPTAPGVRGPPAGPTFLGEFKQLGMHYEWSPIVSVEHPLNAPTDPSTFVPRSAEVDTLVSPGPLRPGDRAPDAPGLVVGGTQTDASAVPIALFDLFAPTQHVALVFVTSDAQVTAMAAILKALHVVPKALMRVVVVSKELREDILTGAPGELVLLDKESHAFNAYQPGRFGPIATVIVRPDAMVGAIVHSANGVKSYLERVCPTVTHSRLRPYEVECRFQGICSMSASLAS